MKEDKTPLTCFCGSFCEWPFEWVHEMTQDSYCEVAICLDCFEKWQPTEEASDEYFSQEEQ
jgi:hypothetical protein